MSEAGDGEPEPERKLPPTQIAILYWLTINPKFRGSKAELRRQMGYRSDGSINPHLNKLIDGGYVKEKQTKTGTAYRLTQKGRNSILHLRLPDYLLLVIGVIGVLDVYAAFEYYAFKFALSPITVLITGVVLLVMYFVISFLRKGIAKETLKMREPLGESETTPRDG